MKSFTTTGPAALSVRFAAGRLTVSTTENNGDLTTTTVDVRPSNPESSADVEHAGATAIEQRGDTIAVVAPTARGWFGRSPRLDVHVVVPPNSRIDADVKSADVGLAGDFGEVSVTTASGHAAIEHAAELEVHTASGDVSCRSVDGQAAVNTASGDVRLDEVGGSAELSTASGDVNVLHVVGDARARSASGDVVVEQADRSITVRTASGDIRIASVRRAAVEIDTASGDIEIGVVAGTSAWLDVQALSGSVSSTLDPADAPSHDAETVSIHAHTLSGDIQVRRAPN